MDRFKPNGVVTLTTDFGTCDGYVGAMKGVISARFPAVRLVDITHDVSPQQVRAGAQTLANACPFFAEGAVHVAVIDPGVGTSRAAVVALHGGCAWIAPDNGVLSRIVPEDAPAWRIERRDLWLDKVSRTFHGRDIFAPIAAEIASGHVPPEEMGPRTALRRLPEPRFERGAGCLRGEIISVDRFGNLVTNIPLEEFPTGYDLSKVQVGAGDITVDGISWSYADVGPGEWVSVIGSNDTVELSVREGSAASESGLRAGAEVRATLPARKR